jgi:flagellar motor switch protein FliG
MNMNDYRLNAYKNAAGSQDDSEIIDGKTVKKFNPGRRYSSDITSGEIVQVNKEGFPVQGFSDKNRPFSSQSPYQETQYTKNGVPRSQGVSQNDIQAQADLRNAANRLFDTGLLKVGSDKVKGKASSDGKDSMYRRVAKFLLLIGIDEAAKILPHLTEEQTERIIPEIASIRQIDPEEAETILAEFQSLVTRARQNGGVDTAYSILAKAYGPEKAAAMIKKAVPDVDGKPFEYLSEIDADRLNLLISDESIAVQAIVLSKVKPQTAAQVLNMMDENAKKDVVIRLARMKSISPEVIKRMDKTMHEKLKSLNVSAAQKTDGRGALAQILRKMDPNVEQNILDTLSMQDPDLSRDLRDRLFTIEDVINADDRYIQKVLRDMDNGDIAFLLGGKDNAFRLKILSNISKGRGDLVLEEEQLKKPMLKRDVEKVTTKFFSELRRAWEDGSLIVKGDDDIYV